MSGIAEVLHHLGSSVQGSDITENDNVKRLRRLGIPIHIGHRPENLGNASVVVLSSAINQNNPEVIAAHAARRPVIPRAVMLGELMRLKWSIAISGTHGKTTTTSMIATVLETAGYDPTVISGGIINAYGNNIRLGTGPWMVVEADESDGTFIKLPATIAVVTSIDPEHLDYYESIDLLRNAFERFIQNTPYFGFTALCLDHPEVQTMIPRVDDRPIVTYGLNPQADVRATNIMFNSQGSYFDVVITKGRNNQTYQIKNIHLPTFGHHNIQNALAAISIAHRLALSDEAIRQGFKCFTGVKRRFTCTGESNNIRVIDDYGHHPVEIKAVLKAARMLGRNRTIAVVQPHRYTRLASLFEEFCTCFNDADVVVISDVYPAGEEPIPRYDRDALVYGIRRYGHRDVRSLADPMDSPKIIFDIAQPNDLVICLGAGSITGWANKLPSQLDNLLKQHTHSPDHFD